MRAQRCVTLRATSSLATLLTMKQTKRQIGSSTWLSKAQLLVKYGQDSELVDQLIEKKKAEGAAAPHPDLSDVEVYLCRIPRLPFAGVADLILCCVRLPAASIPSPLFHVYSCCYYRCGDAVCYCYCLSRCD